MEILWLLGGWAHIKDRKHILAFRTNGQVCKEKADVSKTFWLETKIHWNESGRFYHSA